jgi:hypothetical protein
LLSRYNDWLPAGRPRGRGSSPGSGKIFSSSRPPDRFRGPPSILSNWVPGALSPGVKLPGREADHSPPTSAEVKDT